MSCKVRCGLPEASYAEFAWWEVKIEGVLYTQIGGWRLLIFFSRLRVLEVGWLFFAIYVESTYQDRSLCEALHVRLQG